MLINFGNDACVRNSELFTFPENCKQIYSSLRDYALDQEWLNIDEILDLCYIDDDECYYKGKPTCVYANS